jgi:hypothetical protein
MKTREGNVNSAELIAGYLKQNSDALHPSALIGPSEKLREPHRP